MILGTEADLSQTMSMTVVKVVERYFKTTLCVALSKTVDVLASADIDGDDDEDGVVPDTSQNVESLEHFPFLTESQMFSWNRRLPSPENHSEKLIDERQENLRIWL